jgi:hypothetical protein
VAGTPMKYTDEQIEQAIDLYLKGVKTDVIQEQTGLPRASLYWHLQQRGHAPKRQPSAQMGSRTKATDTATFGWMMERIESQAKRIAQLEDALREAGIEVPV